MENKITVAIILGAIIIAGSIFSVGSKGKYQIAAFGGSVYRINTVTGDMEYCFNSHPNCIDQLR